MDPLALSALLILMLFVFLGSGLWVALSLFAVALVAMEFFTGSPAGLVFATTVWGASASWTLTALPLFIWMGEILFRTRLAEDMFQGLAPWMARLPGRLAHVNIVGCGIFAAVSGSSAATCATIGRMSLPELKKRGYDERLSIGTLAGSGTPPLVMCHISHLYPSGASLYFTFLARAQEGRELDQWRAAKTAASDAIVANGGTITHHHAVGRDHAPWMRAEVGQLGIELLRAAKDRLDPAGVMNPEKLVPPVG